MRQQDDAIFREIYPAMRQFAAVTSRGGIDPDDLLQEALYRTLARQPLSEIDHPDHYLRRVMFRLACNGRRDRFRRKILQERTLPAATTTPDDAYAIGDCSLIERLDPAQRAVVYLHAVEGFSHDEIAAQLGLSGTAVRARYSRGLATLRRELQTALSPTPVGQED